MYKICAIRYVRERGRRPRRRNKTRVHARTSKDGVHILSQHQMERKRSARGNDEIARDSEGVRDSKVRESNARRSARKKQGIAQESLTVGRARPEI